MMEDDTVKRLEEVVTFLAPTHRRDVRLTALGLIAPFASEEKYVDQVLGLGVMRYLPQMISAEELDLSKEALSILVNLSSGTSCRAAMLSEEYPYCTKTMDFITDCLSSSSSSAKTVVSSKAGPISLACMFLANLTIEKPGQEQFLDLGKPYEGRYLLKILGWLDRYSGEMSESFDHLSYVLTNVSQQEVARKILMDRSRGIIPTFAYQLQKFGSVRKHGILRTLRNCGIELDKQDVLVEDESNLIPAVLNPIIGSDLIDSKEYDEMPKLIQLLWTPGKCRDEDSTTRKLTFEFLQVLVRSPQSRKILKDMQVYPILRDAHSWERDEEIQGLIEDLVQWFIVDEPTTLQSER